MQNWTQCTRDKQNKTGSDKHKIKLVKCSFGLIHYFLMVILTQWGKILRGVPNHVKFLPFIKIKSHQQLQLSPSHQTSCSWSCSQFQPCAGLQSCPWCAPDSPLLVSFVLVEERSEWKKQVCFIHTHELRSGGSVIDWLTHTHSQSVRDRILAGSMACKSIKNVCGWYRWLIWGLSPLVWNYHK